MAEPADKPESNLTESPDATEESPEEMEMKEIFQEKPASSHTIHPDGNERPPIRMVLGSFFYGYIVTQIPGGWLSTKFGGKVLFGGGIAMTALLTLFTPLATKGGAYALMGMRIVEGLFEGVTYPSIHAIWKNWAPPLERSQLATAAFSGSYVGTFLCLPISGVLAQHVGWPSIFYVFDSPATHSTISYQELEYITQTITIEGGVAKFCPFFVTPTGRFSALEESATSGPVWAILVAHFCENWGFYTMLTSLPLFLRQIFHYDLAEDGVLSALPYLVMAVVVMGSGQLADFLRQRQLLSTTAVRKTFNCTVCETTVQMFAIRFLHTSVLLMRESKKTSDAEDG
ncbi:hypothetical protein Bbelb_441710 [Branchiostoma belcheri]|nr:hypothetical protein Bbelb_441710 [Branchiostoma belcheri]